MSEQQKVIATLVHGTYFDYKGQVWDKNKEGKASQEVDAETEAYLREHAVHVIEVDGEDYSKNRFKFSNDAEKPTRQRRRAE